MQRDKVVFILNSIQIPRIIKRINEFCERGIDVETYAFFREGDDASYLTPNFSYTIIGRFPNNISYAKRFPIIYRSLKELKKKLGRQDYMLYISGLDTAIVSKLLFTKPYVYEEADLVHTYTSNTILKKTLEIIDKRIIKRSYCSVFTSEGFLEYHFGEERPDNSIVIPNKLHPSIKELPYPSKRTIDPEHLSFAFVGSFRFKALAYFVSRLLTDFPNHEFHVYGVMTEVANDYSLNKFPNFIYHGPFKNPYDLPSIYSSIDVVLSAYDTDSENVKWLEPNKIYESIYFKKPIIVSFGTYLSRKVDRLGIGFSIDPYNNDAIKELVFSLTESCLNRISDNINKLGEDYPIDNIEPLLRKLNFISNE